MFKLDRLVILVWVVLTPATYLKGDYMASGICMVFALLYTLLEAYRTHMHKVDLEREASHKELRRLGTVVDKRHVPLNVLLNEGTLPISEYEEYQKAFVEYTDYYKRHAAKYHKDL